MERTRGIRAGLYCDVGMDYADANHFSARAISGSAKGGGLRMTTLMSWIATLMVLSGWASGYLSGYHETPSTATLAYRRESGHALDTQYHLAVQDCSLVGRRALLFTQSGVFELSIFDCTTSDTTIKWMEENNILGEVSWNLWQDYPEIVHTKAALIILGGD